MRYMMGLAALALAMPVSAQAEDGVLKPNTMWISDFTEKGCRLMRSFGDEDEPTVLMLQQWAPATTFRWTVAGPNIARTRWQDEVMVQWGPKLPAYEQEFARARLGNLGEALLGRGLRDVPHPDEPISNEALLALDPAKLASAMEPVLAEVDTAQAAEIEYVSFRQGKRLNITLQLPNLGEAVAAMNACTRDLAKSWGFGDEYADRLTTVPQFANPIMVARLIQENYHVSPLYPGAQSDFNLRIIVGADGKPERCDWINETNIEASHMRRTPCDIVMAHAEFEPAMDQDEEPIRAILQNSVVYRMR